MVSKLRSLKISPHSEPLEVANVSYFPQVLMFVTPTHQSAFSHQTGRDDEENSYNNDFKVIDILLIPYGFTEDLDFPFSSQSATDI